MMKIIIGVVIVIGILLIGAKSALDASHKASQEEWKD